MAADDSLLSRRLSEVMTANPVCIRDEALAASREQPMEPLPEVISEAAEAERDRRAGAHGHGSAEDSPTPP